MTSVLIISPDSIRSAASTIAYGLVKYYTGNVTNTPETIAMLPPPHYWWQSGAMWGLLVDYFHFTGDSTYNAITSQALESQMGPDFDYMVPLRQNQEANDDQAFWGFSTMSAAEKGFPEPSTGGFTWLQLTERLWNTQVRRWDPVCGGGLKWQIFESNNGYNYKNSVSNGAFFQLSARLARMTGNQTYADWAEKTWDWSAGVGLLGSDYSVYDGTDALKGCKEINSIEWSYNLGIFMYGTAMMYDYSNGDEKWKARTQGLLDKASWFFTPYENSTNIMYEYACEPVKTCNYDQFSFKGYLSRFMWQTATVAPFTKDRINTLLQRSAQAAAESCSGGTDGVTCGTKWYTGGWDGTYGAGQQMSALETVQGLLSANAAAPIRRVGSAPPAAQPAPSPEPKPSPSPSPSPQPAPAPETEPVPTTSAPETTSTKPEPIKVPETTEQPPPPPPPSTLTTSTTSSTLSTSERSTTSLTSNTVKSTTMQSSSSRILPSTSTLISLTTTSSQILRVRPTTDPALATVASTTAAPTPPLQTTNSSASSGKIDLFFVASLLVICVHVLL